MKELIAAKKAAVRREVKQQVKLLTAAEIEAASSAILAQTLCLPAFAAARTVMAYSALPGEPQTAALWQAVWQQGKRLCLPVCIAPGVMEARLLNTAAELVTDRHGIPCPPESAPVIEPADIDLIIVPCVACAADGRRLGKGAGYYDRFLAQTVAYRAAWCLAAALRDDIATDEHDLLMDTVITEKEVYTR